MGCKQRGFKRLEKHLFACVKSLHHRPNARVRDNFSIFITLSVRVIVFKHYLGVSGSAVIPRTPDVGADIGRCDMPPLIRHIDIYPHADTLWLVR